MDEIRALIKGLRQENIYHRKFVPELSLRRAMTKEVIHKALGYSGINMHQQKEITARIIRSGRKIFAILILMNQIADVLRFIEADELQDAKLPWKVEVLKDEIAIPNADDFDERQWEFAAPTFIRGTLNRRFKEKMILPFIAKSDEGRGAFGKVYKLQLHEGHQGLDSSFPQQFVQKELENTDDHRKELENLSILNHLKHPNIIELLTSYTYQNKHSLLFPRAEHGTLTTLLKTSRHDTEFRSNSTFLIALAGLASAIEHIHNFFERRIDLKLIGCHHDLRPDNILVSGTTFILADFGLSRFKESLRDSDTPFRRGMGDYLAPECEDLDTFEPYRIHRSSDIWSFGCILAEAATYMTYEDRGIEEFRSRRRLTVRAYIFYLFHNGPNRPSIAVANWLSELEQSQNKSCEMLVTLVRKMLSINQSERPKACEVTCRLRLIALSEVTAAVDKLFRGVRAQLDSLDVVIEQTRFMAWKYAIGLKNLENDPGSLWASDHSKSIQYDSILDSLVRVREYLEWRLGQQEELLLDFSQLSALNDGLIELLGAEEQERSRNFFRISITDTDDKRLAEQIGSSDQGLSLDKEVRMSTALKHMTNLMKDNHDPDTSQRQIDPKTIHIVDKFGDHSIGEIKEEGHKHRRLVEWRRYGNYSADEVINQTLFVRLNTIVKRLSAEKPESMRSLHCNGYFHDEGRHAFGILYEIPRPIARDSSLLQYSSLHQLIAETTSKAKLWPVLDDRFKLAHTLAKSILEFHLLGWLHKGLTASNVAFFTARGTPREELIQNPYIIGFNHSRPDDHKAFTSGIKKSEILVYQHPKYRRDTRGYKLEYDYYSLGVVLMEIGYWRPFHEIVGFKGTYGEEHDKKLKDRIPQLRQYMGREFCEAVMVCINGDFASSNASDDKGSNKGVLIGFETKVLSRLNNCLV